MATSRFHEEPYDAGTLTKLKIFELYAQEWIPVFVSKPEPRFQEVHIYDLFSGPGTDSKGELGSPLRILRQVRSYQKKGMAGWSKVTITVHLSDEDKAKVAKLDSIVKTPEWQIPGVKIVVQPITFRNALEQHRKTLEDRRAAKLLIIDQFGVDEVTDEVFKQLIAFPTTDFIFFLSSSTLHRFRDHPAIKIKIAEVDDSYDVHRAAIAWFRKLAPQEVFLSPFSIKKRSNIYGLIFGSRHPLGIHKFLQVAWENDTIRGEANFDIDREELSADEPMLPMAEFRPDKVREFETNLERALREGKMRSEADIIRFCIEAGMTCSHATSILESLKEEGAIECDFRTPNVRNFYKPRDLQRHS
jgi:three-Cys-motif partner protein